MDVIILGAGMAGLAAAEGLARRGYRVLVLEARDRVGGRIDTRDEPGWPVPVEAGAEFLHGLPPALEGLRRTLGLRRRELPQRRGEGRGGKLVPATRAWQAAMKLLEELPSAGVDLTYAELCRTPGWRRLADARTQQLARTFVEGYNAAAAEQVSVVSLGQQTAAAGEIEGDRLFRLVGGYRPLVEGLAARAQRAGARVQLGTVVRRIVWRPGQVTVHGETLLGSPLPPVSARAAVVTLPLGVLKEAGASGVRFAPALPAEKRDALASTSIGPVMRLLLRFRRLPDVIRRRGFTFVQSPGAFPTFWRAGFDDEPVLVAWAAGPAAEALARTDDRGRVRAALLSLARALGDRSTAVRARALAADLEGWRLFDWQADRFARGAYSYVTPGASDAPRRLAAPLADTLFFAGEATHTEGATGTVHGAYETGLRAVPEVAAVLAPKRKSRPGEGKRSHTRRR